MFGNMIGLKEYWNSGFRCEELILSCFCLHTNSNRNHKHRKNIATQKNSILFKLDLEFHIEFQPLLHPSIYFDMNYDHFGVKSPMRLFWNNQK